MDYITSFFQSTPEKPVEEPTSSSPPPNYTDPRLEHRLKNFQAIVEYYTSTSYDWIPKSVLAKLIDHFDQQSPPTYREVMIYFKENELSQYYNYVFRIYRLFREDIPVLDIEQIEHLQEQFKKISWSYYSCNLERELSFSYLFHQLCLFNQYQLGDYIEYNIYQAEEKLPQYQETWNQILQSKVLITNL